MSDCRVVGASSANNTSGLRYRWVVKRWKSPGGPTMQPVSVQGDMYAEPKSQSFARLFRSTRMFACDLELFKRVAAITDISLIPTYAFYVSVDNVYFVQVLKPRSHPLKLQLQQWLIMEVLLHLYAISNLLTSFNRSSTLGSGLELIYWKQGLRR